MISFCLIVVNAENKKKLRFQVYTQCDYFICYVIKGSSSKNRGLMFRATWQLSGISAPYKIKSRKCITEIYDLIWKKEQWLYCLKVLDWVSYWDYKWVLFQNPELIQNNYLILLGTQHFCGSTTTYWKSFWSSLKKIA